MIAAAARAAALLTQLQQQQQQLWLAAAAAQRGLVLQCSSSGGGGGGGGGGGAAALLRSAPTAAAAGLLPLAVQQQHHHLQHHHQQQQQQQRRGIVTSHSRAPKRKHDPYRTPPQNYVQLLQHISRTHKLDKLQELVARYGPRFDAVHVAAAFSRLPTAHKPAAPGARYSVQQSRARRARPAALVARLQALAAAQVPRMFAREAASIVWALGRCRALLPAPGSEQRPAAPDSRVRLPPRRPGQLPTARGTSAQDLTAALLKRLGADNARLLYSGATGAEAAKLLHGLARLRLGSQLPGGVRMLCRFIARVPERLHARELAAAAWALATMRPAPLPLDATAEAALDAIARRVVEERLYLRPASICSLATALVRLRRRDEALLAVLAEEAAEQLRDFRDPRHLAVLAWALGALRYRAPADGPAAGLPARLAAAARGRLEGLSALQLGMVLNALRRLPGALDSPEGGALLAVVAAGIGGERHGVRLAPGDAARILKAFVAAPRAGSAADVEAMAAGIGDAVRGAARRMPPAVVASLLDSYAKLGALHEPLVWRLVDEAVARPGAFGPAAWARVLGAAARLGLGAVVGADTEQPLDAPLWRAADAQLAAHLRGAALPGSVEDEDDEEEALADDDEGVGLEGEGGEEGAHAALLPPLRHELRFNAAVDVAVLLAGRKALSAASAECLADVGRKLLPRLSERRLMRLLTAVTSDGALAAVEDVRSLLVDAAARLADADAEALSAQSLTTLAGLLRAVGTAMRRNMLVARGDQLRRRLCAAVAPRLAECDDRQQLLDVWEAVRQVPRDERAPELVAAAEAAEAAAAARGWSLPRDSDWGPLSG